MSTRNGIMNRFFGKVGFQVSRLLLVIWSIAVLFPLVWTIYSSLKDNKEFYTNPWAFPKVLHFENYYNAWVTSNVSRYFINSLILLVIPLILSTLMASMTSYVLAKFKVSWKKYLVLLYTAPLFVPGVITLIPLFFLSQKLHMTNSISGLIVIYSLMPTAFATLQLVAFFKSIPDSLPEAAKMDGCSEFGVFFKIMLPLIKPGLATVCVVSGLQLWNEYATALTFLSDEKKFTVPIGVSFLSAGAQYRTDFGALFAGLTIAMIPPIIIYALFQRQLIESSIYSGSVKT